MIPLQSIPTLRPFLFLLFLAVCSAQPLLAARKEALLIANSRYSHFPGLPNSLSDAAKLRAALEKIGFRVRLLSNASKEQMDDAVRDFENQLRNTGAIAFFHYGGHGVQVDGKNYLIPSDAEIPDENRVATRSLPLEEVMAALGAARPRASIVVVDACRDNPLPATSVRSMARGLSVVEQKPNIIVIFSAQAGRIAKDGLFTPILANAIQTPGRTIEQIMKTVRTEVYQKSGSEQTPGEYNQLFEDFFLWDGNGDEDPSEFFSTSSPTPTPKPAPTPKPTPPPVIPNQSPTPVKNQKPPDANMVFIEGGKLPHESEMAGKTIKSFFIGRTEVTWLKWKKVRNWSTNNGYDIGRVGEGSGNDHPVRNVNWYDCVKWCNALSEMEGLSPVYEVKGEVYRRGEYGPIGSSVVQQNTRANGYRLPTEAEWEWAARGGIKSRGYQYSGSDDLNQVGWYRGNSKGAKVDLGSVVLKKYADYYKDTPPEEKRTMSPSNSPSGTSTLRHPAPPIGCGTFPVGQKKSNELNLHDMSGNVYEFCWDFASSGQRRVRGGCWDDIAELCTLNNRYYDFYPPDRYNEFMGIRLAKNY